MKRTITQQSIKAMLVCLFAFTGIKQINAQTGCWKTASVGSSHTAAIKNDGTLWTCGSYNYGELGYTYYRTQNNFPNKVGTANNWQAVSSNWNRTMAIKTDGTLWAWGYNTSGQLGDSTTTFRKVPTQIGTANNWQSVSAGNNHTLAIKSDGSLWAWGANGSRQLGDGTFTQRNSPVRIGTATNWQSVSGGDNHSMAIKTDGTLWAWGNNALGELGKTGLAGSDVPIQIGTANNWQSVVAGFDYTLAIKTDGTLWAWGTNITSQLGDGTTTQRNTPVQIGTGTNWKSVSAGQYNSAAIKTDGTLWAWGSNDNGQLGDGTTTTRSNPVQIGSATNWQSVITNSHTIAIKTDGSIWTWGNNSNGQLGNDDASHTNKSAPVGVACNLPSPVITSFSPTVAPANTVITIKGHNFTGATQVNFGNRSYSTLANNPTCTVLNDSTITAQTYYSPSTTSGYIYVISVYGTDSLAGFTYCEQTPATVSLSVITGGTPNQTFVATPNNTGGGTVTYKFFANGFVKQTGLSNVWNAVGLIKGTAIQCEFNVTNTNGCVSTSSGQSNAIIVCIPVTPVVKLVGGPGTNYPQTFIAQVSSIAGTNTYTGGGTLSYDFKKNGITQQNGANNQWNATSLANGDVISCVVNFTGACVTSPSIASNPTAICLSGGTLPAIGVSTGGLICYLGSTLTIYNSNTTGGGVWSSSDTNIATIKTVSGATGVATAKGPGIATMSYIKTSSSGCKSVANTTVVVGSVAAPAAISGATSLCKGAVATLTSATPNGIWKSMTTSTAKIDSVTGVVTGLYQGTATIRYTVTNAYGCSNFNSLNLPINAIPSVPTVAYAAGTVNPQVGPGGGFCVNDTFKIVGTPAGGVFSSSNTATATVGASTGKVKMLSLGSTSISYTFTAANGCSNSQTFLGVLSVTCPSHRGVTNINTQMVSSSDFILYPNPARSTVSLQVERLVGSGNIVVSDLYGKQVKIQALSMGNNTVDVSNLAKGFYLVSMITSEGKTTKKLVVE